MAKDKDKNPYQFDPVQLAQMQDKDLLWMIHRDIADVRRRVTNISAIVTLWLVLSLIGGALLFLGSVQASSEADADRRVECILDGGVNC